MSNRVRVSRLHRVLLAGAVAFIAAITPMLTPGTPASAAPVIGFSPGNIIDDSTFYNGNAMAAVEVQNFLNQRLSSCRIGVSPYLPGALSPSGSGNIIANNCLKDFRQTTTSQPGDKYCSAYAGAVNETGAQIIAKVGQACGISQKVLLVMLEKEQSLLTDDWPVTRQYNYAMGMNCPDSGPNNSANCDAESAGFSKQLYLGARQLKVYKGNPDSFNYKPFRNNTIQWHPNSGCGTSQVYIENWATAALYIYTPYRPNQAALNAGWGTGDSCSSYGNRNFYNFYKSWFGGSSTPSIPVHPVLQNAYDQSGGSTGSFGAPASIANTAISGVVEQRFASGTLYWSQQTDISSTRGAIRTLYESAGGPTGLFGLPMAHEISENGWVRQEFQGGTGFWTSADGAGLIRGGIRTQYFAHSGIGGLSGVGGYLGLPIGKEEPLGEGVFQKFQRGEMFWTPASKETWTRGGIGGEHARLDGAAGRLGFPLAVERDEIGYAVQDFERGKIYWTSQIGSRAVLGAIYQRFEAEGGDTGAFGLPLSGEVETGTGMRQEFVGATAYWRSDLGVTFVRGGIKSAFISQGGPTGYLGFPVSVEATVNNWASQEFERGTAFWSERTSTIFTRGAVRDAYKLAGGHEGLYGHPTTSEINEAGGVRQEFENATAYWSSPTGAAFVRDKVRTTYQSLGGPKSFLGYPLKNEQEIGDWVRQDFEKGSIYWSEKSGGVSVRGAIRTEFLAKGAESGEFGYPLTSEISENAGVRQEFENVTVRWTSAGGVKTFPKGIEALGVE